MGKHTPYKAELDQPIPQPEYVQNTDKYKFLLEQISRLSPVERKVAQLMSSGLKRNEIMAHLNVSTGTLNRHEGSIYRALGVNSREQVIVIWKDIVNRGFDFDMADGNEETSS
jgi:DNA-binding CsgD family transcriptional regulator